MNFVSLSQGKIKISFGLNDRTEHTFKPTEHARIGDLIAEHQAWSFQCSSSCDFPHENGFKRSFDVSDVLGKAVEHARNKLAIPVEPGPLDDADVRIEAAAKRFGGFPVSLKFVKSGKKGEDVVLTFSEENDLEYFTGGIRYARRLVDPRKNGK